MISSVRGLVLAASGSLVVIEVGGIGLSVQTTPAAVLSVRVGHEARLHTALLVRDDELALVGFPTTEELEVFELLRSVSGVGPKSAIGVLAALSPAEVAAAVAADDDGAFRKVSGIGPKTAKLIVVSLAGKVHAPAHAAPAIRARGVDESVVTALIGLGWPERVASQVVSEVVDGAPDESDVPAVLRLALARLGPGGRS
ncbi:Holliday junction branch migration protein RuvA [uncultured Schumannella sp.]|uniref:Holliday junction branch migration protein RuvA n=1 Tax=uncultured Schumannella sp. TaxID=1195956 RepID=UPI0025F840CA|nr:Holliday junction branch migration protein RuvA [uncultured Schumannella sp.]